MLNSQVVLHQQYTSLITKRNLYSCNTITPFGYHSSSKKRYNNVYIHICAAGNNISKIKAVANTTTTTTNVATIKQSIKLTATLVVQNNGAGFFNIFKFGAITIELVAAHNFPDGKNKETIKKEAKEGDRYMCTFDVGQEFGEIGAVICENKNNKETYLEAIHLDGYPSGRITLNCVSWLQPNSSRIFFTSKSYTSSQTPSGLIDYRKKELSAVRGDGKGERKKGDRIYDYDIYNDLGDPDNGEDKKRVVLGGNPTYPYPRRCRTGRPSTKKDQSSESRTNDSIYVPRDEYFSDIKLSSFNSEKTNAFLPVVENTVVEDGDLGFPYFTEIDLLFYEKGDLPQENRNAPSKFITRIVDFFQNSGSFLQYKTPEVLERDKFSWLKDEEFARQTLAGVNPCTIQLVKQWPLKSNLDPVVYGEPESAITRDMVECMMDGRMTVEEAIKEKRLFVIDYHDLLLPYVEKVREIKGRTFYGSRALFFRTHLETLKPIAIELVRPPGRGKPQWKEAYTPSSHNTSGWIWKLAKAQFLALDSGYHQLISHWLRTHCVAEPYVIATNRQLSAMHPIYRLLKPHFKDTMEINANAREILVGADGLVETIFSPGKYGMEFSSVAYRELWRFDQEGLPADLIKRGMAEEDPTSDTGVKLTIEDYPYASDGMLLWTAIKNWVKAYVSHYYPDASHIESDYELGNWWTEIRTVGHGDKKDEPWWPKLQTLEDVIEILTTIIWIASGHHAAVNFGQYDFTAYIPNRPSLARTKMPTEDPTDESWDAFIVRPEDTILACYPTSNQARRLVATMDVLSNHSKDEEYIGQNAEPSWAENEVIMAEFELFRAKLMELDKIIDERNKTMRNRTGAGVVPYNLFKTTSKEGITGMGVPNSISI